MTIIIDMYDDNMMIFIKYFFPIIISSSIPSFIWYKQNKDKKSMFIFKQCKQLIKNIKQFEERDCLDYNSDSFIYLYDLCYNFNNYNNSNDLLKIHKDLLKIIYKREILFNRKLYDNIFHRDLSEYLIHTLTHWQGCNDIICDRHVEIKNLLDNYFNNNPWFYASDLSFAQSIDSNLLKNDFFVTEIKRIRFESYKKKFEEIHIFFNIMSPNIEDNYGKRPKELINDTCFFHDLHVHGDNVSDDKKFSNTLHGFFKLLLVIHNHK